MRERDADGMGRDGQNCFMEGGATEAKAGERANVGEIGKLAGPTDRIGRLARPTAAWCGVRL